MRKAFVNDAELIKLQKVDIELQILLQRGSEPPDSVSLSYADTSLQDVLDWPSLHYADQASAMQTMAPRCSKRASTIQHSFFKILVCMCNEKC